MFPQVYPLALRFLERFGPNLWSVLKRKRNYPANWSQHLFLMELEFRSAH